ncbi:OsmC family protein [uncultured Enterococcus sp.]|uniref:OsmC family protein n=1 Tax=uncultured Enterococcus sp. TaxID=167972 RepID=UPI0025CF29FE|nr:OsmC family protein [uncultured Enterococcus sp.]
MSKHELTIIKGTEKFELAAPDKNWILAYEEGYSPVQMLASAAGACGGYVYSSILENSKIPFEFKKIELSYTRDETKKAEPLASITMVFHVIVASKYQERAEKCLRLVSANCPVIQSLDPTIEIHESVVFA